VHLEEDANRHTGRHVRSGTILTRTRVRDKDAVGTPIGRRMSWLYHDHPGGCTDT